MGRPLNKRFFGDAAGRIATTARIGGGNELCFITEQRSNTAYRVDSEAGPSTRTGVCTLVQGAPAAENEMQVTVQAENAVTPVEATFTFSTTGGGAVSAVDIVTGGYGYWTNGATFNITVASDAGYVAGTESIVTLTVANGSIVSVGFTAGAGYSNSIVSDPIVAADVLDVDANPPLENARIINARQVKTFEGNTFDWPITAPLGTPAVGGLTQADLQTQ